MSAIASTASISEAAPVEVHFPEPEIQRRWTIALRLLLLIPQLIVTIAFGVAVRFLIIAGWLSSLVLGRLPTGIASFLANVVRYWTRVYAYGLLLLDAYPPFGFDEPYPVAVEIEPARLRRASVFFRLLLAIPAFVVATVLAVGVSVAAIPAWLIVLVLGRMPRPLYQASGAAIRYEARYTAYLLLLTSAYPRRLFGDHELLLSRAAKGIVVLFLVLGLAGWVGGGVLLRAEASNTLANHVIADYNRTGSAATDFGKAASSCSSAARPMACVQRLTPGILAALDRYHAQLRALHFPASAQPDALSLEAAISRMMKGVRHLAKARTETSFTTDAVSVAYAGDDVDQLTQQLVDDLS